MPVQKIISSKKKHARFTRFMPINTSDDIYSPTYLFIKNVLFLLPYNEDWCIGKIKDTGYRNKIHSGNIRFILKVKQRKDVQMKAFGDMIIRDDVKKYTFIEVNFSLLIHVRDKFSRGTINMIPLTESIATLIIHTCTCNYLFTDTPISRYLL